MKILLVSPDTQDDTYHAMAREIAYLGGRGPSAAVAPLALATVAALTPPGHEVRIHDENLRGPVEALLRRERFDVIGISALDIQIGRVCQIGRFCKDNGIQATLALGGPGTGFLSRRVGEVIDVVFVGEAEETWPQFLRELAQGAARALYQQVSKPDMRRSPMPRWELIREDLPRYACGAVQTTRGCPFDCDFCDVITLYGRRPRSKTAAQVLDEVRRLHAMGVRTVFISDDDFTGNRRQAKALLRALKPLNDSFDVPLQFLTQADITIADDPELLELLADCNFVDVVVGVESANAEALRELNKRQNLRRDLRASVRRIQSYGIAVLGSMLVGADTDDVGAFDAAEALVRDMNLTDHYLHPLVAPFGTKLWYRMRREGRVLDVPIEELHKVISNVIPRRMSRPAWFEATADYYDRVMHPAHYRERAIRFVDGVRRRPAVKRPPLQHTLKQLPLLAEIFYYYARNAGKEHREAFFAVVRHTLRTKPWLLPTMLFLHTRFLLVHKRAALSARRLRARAALERAQPELLGPPATSLPVPAAVREQAAAIVGVAYARARLHPVGREAPHAVLLEALVDYIDRFGAEFSRLDALERDRIGQCCDRVLARRAPSAADPPPIPSTPPASLTRELLDALDLALRARQLVSAPRPGPPAAPGWPASGCGAPSAPAR